MTILDVVIQDGMVEFPADVQRIDVGIKSDQIAALLIEGHPNGPAVYQATDMPFRPAVSTCMCSFASGVVGLPDNGVLHTAKDRADDFEKYVNDRFIDVATVRR